MAIRKRGRAQAPNKQYVAKVRKLQRAGLLKNIDVRKKPTPGVFAQFTKHKDILSGRVAPLRASSRTKAKEIRSKLGVKGTGTYVYIPREKGERVTITKAGKIKSKRTRYGQTIEKEIGGKIEPPKPGEKFYYTLPYRKRGLTGLARHTFASFDEMLFYLTRYEINFEDIEDYIEVEKVHDGSAKDQTLHTKYVKERRKAYRNYQKKYARKRRRKSKR